jgi:hypothetical protein
MTNFAIGPTMMTDDAVPQGAPVRPPLEEMACGRFRPQASSAAVYALYLEAENARLRAALRSPAAAGTAQPVGELRNALRIVRDRIASGEWPDRWLLAHPEHPTLTEWIDALVATPSPGGRTPDGPA